MARLIASFFGTGLILRQFLGGDKGSGTVGGFCALVISLAIAPAGVWVQVALAVALTAASLVSVRRFADLEGDPGWVVIDEAAGSVIATIGLGTVAAVVGWLLFRVADIFKRAFPGVAAAEDLHGALGVTADDVVAGFYGLAAGWATQIWIVDRLL